MSQLELPPADAGVLEYLTDWLGHVQVCLFTNPVQTSEPRALSDYAEAAFPGYQRFCTAQWLNKFILPTGDFVEVATQVEWLLTANISPLQIYGWFATIIVDGPELVLVAEHVAPSPITMSAKGQRVRANIILTCARYAQ